MVLARGIQQIAGAGLHHTAQTQYGEGVPHLADLRRQVGGEGVEMGVVEGERNRGVPQIGDDPQRIVQAMVGESVRTITEA